MAKNHMICFRNKPLQEFTWTQDAAPLHKYTITMWNLPYRVKTDIGTYVKSRGVYYTWGRIIHGNFRYIRGGDTGLWTDLGYQTDVYTGKVLTLHPKLELSESLDKWHALDVTNCTTKLQEHTCNWQTCLYGLISGSFHQYVSFKRSDIYDYIIIKVMFLADIHTTLSYCKFKFILLFNTPHADVLSNNTFV